MSETKTHAKTGVESYSVTRSKSGVTVVVTSGTLAGKSVKIISTPGSAAYFSTADLPEKKSA
jgi:hypothetical protein